MTLTCILFWILCLDPIHYEQIEKINYAHVQCEQSIEVAELLDESATVETVTIKITLIYVYVSQLQPHATGARMGRLTPTKYYF